MKFLLTADWHLGVRGNSTIYYNIFMDWVSKFLIPTINENQIDELVVLGDIYDDRNEINVKTDDLSQIAIETILEKCKNVKIKLITGNHDVYYKNTRDVGSLRKFNKFERTSVVNSFERRKIENRTLLYCPWIINRDELLKHIEEKGKADICFGHFAVNGFQMVRGVPEKAGWPQSFFKDNFLKVFSGHFHIRDEQGNIIYIGNPFQMQWGDYSNDKGVYIFDSNTLQTTFIKNNISPEYKKIYLSQLKKKQIDYESMRGQFIQLILDDSFTDKILEKLYEVIKNKEPLSFTVEGDDKSIGLDIETIQDKVNNPIEYLVSYIQELKLPDDIDRDILIKNVNEIYNNCLV